MVKLLFIINFHAVIVMVNRLNYDAAHDDDDVKWKWR